MFDLLPLGSKVYGVHLNYYRDEENKTRTDYIVTNERVRQHYEWKYKEIITSDGSTPHYYQAKDFGKSVFLTAKEAAQRALALTEEAEKKPIMRKEPPMRRTWERYLENES